MRIFSVDNNDCYENTPCETKFVFSEYHESVHKPTI